MECHICSPSMRKMSCKKYATLPPRGEPPIVFKVPLLGGFFIIAVRKEIFD